MQTIVSREQEENRTLAEVIVEPGRSVPGQTKLWICIIRVAVKIVEHVTYIIKEGREGKEREREMEGEEKNGCMISIFNINSFLNSRSFLFFSSFFSCR